MLTLFEISERYKVSHKKIIALHEDGHLHNVRDATPLEQICFSLRKGNGLSSYQRVLLLRNPQWLKTMPANLQWAAEQNLSHMDDVAGEAWPADKAPHVLIDQAAAGNPEYVARLAHWIAETIPADGCGYHYLALRLLFNVKESVLDLIAGKISRAISKARQDPALAGMSATENRQTKFFQRDL